MTRTVVTASFRADVDLPVAERAVADCLSLPVHPFGDLERIVVALGSAAKAGA